jgi:hypothetical protein
MQTMRLVRAMVLVTVTMVAGVAHGAPTSSGANWVQVDRQGLDLEGAWECPSPIGTTGTFFDVPDRSVSMDRRSRMIGCRGKPALTAKLMP